MRAESNWLETGANAWVLHTPLDQLKNQSLCLRIWSNGLLTWVSKNWWIWLRLERRLWTRFLRTSILDVKRWRGEKPSCRAKADPVGSLQSWVQEEEQLIFCRSPQSKIVPKSRFGAKPIWIKKVTLDWVNSSLLPPKGGGVVLISLY